MKGVVVTGGTGHLGAVGDVLAAPVARWDAVWYLHIAEHGYPHTTEAAYFPLYPLLVHAAAWVTRSTIVAAALVSLAAFLCGARYEWAQHVEIAKRGGIIALILEDSKVRFLVNVDAATQAALTISSRLLTLATIVHTSR